MTWQVSFTSKTGTEKAVPLCTKILTIYERILGKDHLDVATIAVNLAMLYHTQNLYDEAEPLYKRALDVRTMELNAEHPDVINVLENYATLLLVHGSPGRGEYLKTCVMGRVFWTNALYNARYTCFQAFP